MAGVDGQQVRVRWRRTGEAEGAWLWALANFERQWKGPRPGHLRKGPLWGHRTARDGGGPTAVLAKHHGGPSSAPIRSIIEAWRPLDFPSWHGWPISPLFVLLAGPQHAQQANPTRSVPIAMRAGDGLAQ